VGGIVETSTQSCAAALAQKLIVIRNLEHYNCWWLAYIEHAAGSNWYRYRFTFWNVD
jgi:hypothetical protein